MTNFITVREHASLEKILIRGGRIDALAEKRNDLGEFLFTLIYFGKHEVMVCETIEEIMSLMARSAWIFPDG